MFNRDRQNRQPEHPLIGTISIKLQPGYTIAETLVRLTTNLNIRYEADPREQQIERESHPGLTRQQIGNIPTARFSKRPTTRNSARTRRPVAVEEEQAQCCTICLVAYRQDELVRVLPCTHRFHKPCIGEWLRGDNHCPLCKLRVIIK